MICPAPGSRIEDPSSCTSAPRTAAHLVRDGGRVCDREIERGKAAEPGRCRPGRLSSPSRPGPAPGLGRVGPVERHDRPRHVAGIEVRARYVLQVRLPDDPDTQFDSAAARGLPLGKLEDRHVAAVSPSPLEVTMPGGLLGERSEHLDETVACREHPVLEAEVADPVVLEARREPELGLEAPCRRGQVPRDEDDLAEPDGHGHSDRRYPGLSGLFFYWRGSKVPRLHNARLMPRMARCASSS